MSISTTCSSRSRNLAGISTERGGGAQTSTVEPVERIPTWKAQAGAASPCRHGTKSAGLPARPGLEPEGQSDLLTSCRTLPARLGRGGIRGGVQALTRHRRAIRKRAPVTVGGIDPSNEMSSMAVNLPGSNRCLAVEIEFGRNSLPLLAHRPSASWRPDGQDRRGRGRAGSHRIGGRRAQRR